MYVESPLVCKCISYVRMCVVGVRACVRVCVHVLIGTCANVHMHVLSVDCPTKQS